MKTVHDIRVVLYEEAEAGRDIVIRFRELGDRPSLSFRDDADLGRLIEECRERGLRSKDVLILKRFRGRFLQACPGSPRMICCNYRLINTCFNCLFDCSYCYLHSYLNAFGIVQFSNVEEIYREMGLFLEQADRGRIYRIGTGEFTDSLMMDEISGIGRTLIGMTWRHRNIMIEFKTKSDNMDHLLEIKEKGNAVLAWSLNTERNISRYEKDAAPLGERLRAAEKAAAAGYWVAFHFDPIILYGAGEREYTDLVDLLFERIDPAKVVWISLGGFRYAPGFRESLRAVLPAEDLTLEEMFPGEDGKMRYIKGKRIAIYRRMKENILRHTDKPFVYLCMESADVWREVFGKDYRSSRDLEADMGSHLEKNFIGPV